MKIRYEICDYKYLDKLIKFIDENWKKNHIFVQNREMFNWQHKGINTKYNFVISIDQNDNILGMLGFISTSKFSKVLKKNNDVWLTMWKILENSPYPGLGLGMVNFLKKQGYDTICAVGLSDLVKRIYKALNYEVGQLNHYIVFNDKIDKFKFIKPPVLKKVLIKKNNYRYLEMDKKKLKSISKKKEEEIFYRKPFKNIDYVINRYIRHPIYKYKVYGIFSEKNKLETIFVSRVVKIKSISIARIVEFQGKSLLSADYNTIILSYLSSNNLEYADLLFFSEEALDKKKSCFIDIKDCKDLIVPNYFEPLKMQNIDIDFAYKTKDKKNFSIFRGDSDQDRPNQI